MLIGGMTGCRCNNFLLCVAVVVVVVVEDAVGGYRRPCVVAHVIQSVKMFKVSDLGFYANTMKSWAS